MRIVTPREEKEFYGKLKDILHKLPTHFIQIHKSFIINQDCVAQYSYDNVRMMNVSMLFKKMRSTLLTSSRASGFVKKSIG